VAIANTALWQGGPMRVAVVGATGLTGRAVVAVLADRAIDVVQISRANGVDAITGEGLSSALKGVDRVIDVSNTATADEGPATEFFTTLATNVGRAAAEAGVRRVVVLSIVGVDRLSSGYFAAKFKHEQAAFASGVPTVVLRATQFHEFANQVLDWGREGDVTRIREQLSQPVELSVVARTLVELALAEDDPQPITELGGPRVERLADMVERLIDARGLSLRVEETTDDTEDGRAVAQDALLPGPQATLAGIDFQTWLDGGATS